MFTKPGGRALIQNSLRFFHQGFEDFKFMIIIKGLKGFGAGSSARQSSGLLIRWPQVRILPGPPEKSITCSHSSFPALGKCSRFLFIQKFISIYIARGEFQAPSTYLFFDPGSIPLLHSLWLKNKSSLIRQFTRFLK